MGNYISKDLNKIVVNEEPILFMRNKTKLCRILDVKPNNEYQIAFFFKKKLFKMLFKIDDNQNSNYLSDKLITHFNQNSQIVYIKFSKFQNNYLWGNIYLNKKDLKNHYSVKEKFNQSNILFAPFNISSTLGPIPENDILRSDSLIMEPNPYSTFYKELEDTVSKYKTN
jgi:hypothetical protein